MYIFIIIILLIVVGVLVKKLNKKREAEIHQNLAKTSESQGETDSARDNLSKPKPLTKEEKRIQANKKVLMYGCLPVFGFFALIMAFGALLGSNAEEKQVAEAEIKEKSNPFGLTKDSLEALVGEKVPYGKWPAWGSPQTLEGTNNFFYAAYLDSADISFVSNKSTDKVLFAGFGRAAAKDYLLERQKRIEKQFSSYDGSHRNLERAVKKTMDDPDSFDHVSTEYYDRGDHLIVKMTFRGTNAFGGKVINNITVKTSLDGDILDVISQND